MSDPFAAPRPPEDLSGPRRRLARTRATADLIFLVGLLAGGPLMTLGGRFQAGLFLILAGGLASALRRYTPWSTAGVLLMGSATAAVVVAVADGADGMDADATEVGEEVRATYVFELGRRVADGRVEARGPGLVTVWFFLPEADGATCGSVPEPSIREHLGEIGFRRIVVADNNSRGGLCSFAP